jgi:LysM repeat protein
MKILKIFGIVVGIHVFALILIFANPGCSSTANKPTRPSGDMATTPSSTPAPVVGAPSTPSSVYSSTTDSSSAPPISFNPDAPASAAASGSSGSRATPTRPNSAAAILPAPEPARDGPSVTTYTVKSGDNLSTIAKKNNTTVAQLKSANGLKNDSLRLGQKLKIPGKPATVAPGQTPSGGATPTIKTSAVNPPAAARASSDGLKHTVKANETLSEIAANYGVRYRELAVLNSIDDPKKLRAGTELIIPAGGKASPKATNGSTTPPAQPASTSVPVEQIPPPTTTQPSTSPAVPVIKLDDPAPKQP